MELQSFTLNERLSFKIVTNNFIQGAEIKAIFYCYDGSRLMSADSIIALFRCYPAVKRHFGRMDYNGQIDYIVHKDEPEDRDYNVWTCVSITKHKENDHMYSKSWKLRYYDLIGKMGLIIPFSRELLRFLYSHRTLIRNALQYWDNQMSIVIQEMHSCTRVTEISLLNETKRTLLKYTYEDNEFIDPEIFDPLPKQIQNYLQTWNEHDEHYSATEQDIPKPENIIDNDTEFDF
jgi:hypothetical protein